jgi:hypothetical protein
MSASVLTLESVEQRRIDKKSADRVAFRIQGLYGLSLQGMQMPLNKDEYIESGQICVTMDPDADSFSNLGIVDFAQGKLRVKYGAQMVFPGLHNLVTTGRYHPSLLHPVRATATDECTLTEDRSGWHALGCLDFLPGSIWAGAAGG